MKGSADDSLQHSACGLPLHISDVPELMPSRSHTSSSTSVDLHQKEICEHEVTPQRHGSLIWLTWVDRSVGQKPF